MLKYIFLSIFSTISFANILSAMDDQPLFTSSKENGKTLVKLNMGPAADTSKSDKTAYTGKLTKPNSAQPKASLQKNLGSTPKKVSFIGLPNLDEPNKSENEGPLFVMREKE